MHPPPPGQRMRRPLLVVAIVLTVAACAGTSAPPSGTPGPTASRAAATATTAGSSSPTAPLSAATVSPTTGSGASQAPDTGGGTTSGDIPDNAVFLTYHGTNPAFAIHYVEGWQVSQAPDGVVVRDKDSSETVTIVAPQSDVQSYVASTDLPALRTQPGFALVKQDSVAIGGAQEVHLVYHLPAPPDPVTGKRVPSTVDRYYVPGPAGLAVVSLSTPDGVDNVDAFRQMIESFRWS